MGLEKGREIFDEEHTSPPILLVNRKVTVQLDAPNALRYPGDLFERRDNVWFQPGTETAKHLDARGRFQPHPVRENNHVRFFIDGASTFRAMEQAISETGPGDFIYMLNWWADPSMTLSDSQQRFGDLLAAASDRNVQIRGMFWRQSGKVLNSIQPFKTALQSIFTPWTPIDRRGIEEQNEAMVDLLNKGICKIDETLFDPSGIEITLPTDENKQKNPKRIGAAIHDLRLNKTTVTFNSVLPIVSIIPITLNTTVGSTHQKILCVKTGGKLTAFCGGVDFNRDRKELIRMTFGGAPLHDTHCEVVGPIAGDLLANFMARWNDHPLHANLDNQAGGPLIATDNDTKPPADPAVGRHIVQLGKTFGGATLLTDNAGEPTSYSFAPQGEETGRLMIKNAILNARKFIYLEDQYFVNMEASQLLRQALANNNLAHITIVLPHHEIMDLPFGVKHRRAAIKNLKQDHPDRVRVFYRCPGAGKPGDFHTYVHSKLTIIDDEIAIIGSINYAQRSWTHDTEASLGIYDPSSDQILTSRFARWLRIRMWAEHLFSIDNLNRPTPPGKTPKEHDKVFAELFDGVAAGALWGRLIKLKQDFLAKNPSNVPGPSPAPHPRDSGFDQSSDPDPLAQSASVKPYDEDDDPDEAGSFLHKAELTLAGAALSLSPDQIYDNFCDPT